MKNCLVTLSAAAAFLFSAGPAFAQPADSLVTGAAALGFTLPGGELPAVNLPGIPARARAFQPAANALPENCPNMPVLYVKNGDLYKNGKKLGRNASAYKGACSGDAAWRDSYGRIYKNEAELGSSVQDFEIALYTGDVFWKNSYGRLYRNSAEVGSAQVFIVADWTGDVAWRDPLRPPLQEFRRAGRLLPLPDGFPYGRRGLDRQLRQSLQEPGEARQQQ